MSYSSVNALSPATFKLEYFGGGDIQDVEYIHEYVVTEKMAFVQSSTAP